MRYSRILAGAALAFVNAVAGAATAPIAGAGSVVGNIVGTTLGQAGDVLANVGSQLGLITEALAGKYIAPTAGTETFSGVLQHQGLARRWSGIRPVGAPAGAPVLILLHPRGTTPEQTANIARVGRLAADYGAWVYLPESVLAHWNDDPGSGGRVDDVGFLEALVQTAITQDQVDAKHIYVAGYSNGGFMAERFACERSPLVAGLAVVAATLHDAQRSACTFSHPMPVLIFDGTADPILAYRHSLPTVANAAEAIAFFAERSGCDSSQIETSELPQQTSPDLTRVELTHYSACPTTGRADLYTIIGGGHTWPGAELVSLGLGATTHDVDATLVLWQTMIGYSLP